MLFQRAQKLSPHSVEAAVGLGNAAYSAGLACKGGRRGHVTHPNVSAALEAHTALHPFSAALPSRPTLIPGQVCPRPCVCARAVCVFRFRMHHSTSSSRFGMNVISVVSVSVAMASVCALVNGSCVVMFTVWPYLDEKECPALPLRTMSACTQRAVQHPSTACSLPVSCSGPCVCVCVCEVCRVCVSSGWLCGLNAGD